MQELINKIKELKHTIECDVPNDYKVQAGWATIKAEAALDLPKKRAELADRATKELVPTFDEECSDPSIKVDVNKLFGPLTKRVEDSFSRERIFGISQYMLVLAEVRALAQDAGLKRIETPTFGDTEMCYNAGDADRIVRRIVQESTGTQLLGDFVKKAVAQALEDSGSNDVSTVIFVNANAEDKTAIAQSFSKQVQVKPAIKPQEVKPNKKKV